MSKELVEMGKCLKPHGIRGGFKWALYNTHESSLKDGAKVFLAPLSEESQIKKDGEWFFIEKLKWGNHVIVYLQNVLDRTQAEALIPYRIMLPRKEFSEILQENEFYLTDILGLKAIDSTSKQSLGKVVDFYESGAQVVLVLEKKDQTKLELPFVNNFFPHVDLDEKIIEVNLPEYES